MSWLRNGSLGRRIGSCRSGHEPGNTRPNPDPSSPLDTNRDRGVWESDRHLPPCLRSEVSAPVSCLPRLPRPSCRLMRSPGHRDSGHCNQSVFFRSQSNRFPSDPPALPITPAIQLVSRCSSRSSSPESSVIYNPEGKISQEKLENPAGFWNNVEENTFSLFQNKGAFE